MLKHVEDLESYSTGMEECARKYMMQSGEARATAFHQAQEITTLNAQLNALNAQMDALKAQIDNFKASDTRLTMELVEKDHILARNGISVDLPEELLQPPPDEDMDPGPCG